MEILYKKLFQGWEDVLALANKATNRLELQAAGNLIQVVVSNIFYFHPYLGKILILSNIFQMGWFNHQLVMELISLGFLECFTMFPAHSMVVLRVWMGLVWLGGFVRMLICCLMVYG